MKIVGFSSAVWFTNLKNIRKPFKLTKKYNPKDNPKYDNFSAIEVKKTEDIPADYYETMGAPISILRKHCPDQFEIIGFLNCPKIDNKTIYKRIFIRRKK